MAQADRATCEFRYDNVELDCQAFARTTILELLPFFLLLLNSKFLCHRPSSTRPQNSRRSARTTAVTSSLPAACFRPHEISSTSKLLLTSVRAMSIDGL
jgi:hypothetical protein